MFRSRHHSVALLSTLGATPRHCVYAHNSITKHRNPHSTTFWFRTHTNCVLALACHFLGHSSIDITTQVMADEGAAYQVLEELGSECWRFS